ncbi:hypothetical protein BGZ94_000591 [Podila epigama]|nr:hypothetical protein BGZ94_000591 [Podila epigama]
MAVAFFKLSLVLLILVSASFTLAFQERSCTAYACQHAESFGKTGSGGVSQLAPATPQYQPDIHQIQVTPIVQSMSSQGLGRSPVSSSSSVIILGSPPGNYGIRRTRFLKRRLSYAQEQGAASTGIGTATVPADVGSPAEVGSPAAPTELGQSQSATEPLTRVGSTTVVRPTTYVEPLTVVQPKVHTLRPQYTEEPPTGIAGFVPPVVSRPGTTFFMSPVSIVNE